MALTPTNVGNNAAVPAIAAEIFLPDQLIAGPYPIATDSVTIVSGAGVLARGTALGRITASGKYNKSATAAGDGSQTIIAVLADPVDATSADVAGAAVYLTGEFNSNAMTFGTGWTAATAAVNARASNLFIRTPTAGLANTDPT